MEDDSKSYVMYRTVPFSTTLNEPRFQRHAILWRWITQKRSEIQTRLQWNT